MRPQIWSWPVCPIFTGVLQRVVDRSSYTLVGCWGPWRLWSSLGEFLVVTAFAQGIVLSKRCSLSCLLIDRYAPPVHLSQLKSINCTHKDLLTLCVPKIWGKRIVQQSTIVRDCCTIGLAAGRFLQSASKRLHVGRGGGNHKKGLTSLPNTFKERGEGLWTSGQSRTH